VDTVTVECDRCRRPGWWLEVSPLNGEVCVYGARSPYADGSPSWAAFLSGPRTHRYQAAPATPTAAGEPKMRPGAFILSADPAGGYGDRHKLVCIGRKHKQYVRVVTAENVERAYHAAVAAGRDRIGMREIV